MTDTKKFHGLDADDWQAGFRAGIQEFAGPIFMFSRDGDFVRIAFGNRGPYVDENKRQPVYTHAVTMSAEMAIELARQLLHSYAAPTPENKKSAAE
ncbi:MAG TPA: hypothetical protein VHA82_24875 [Ramlibacter sp.]|uniref:hypothetical protein n=1 Tax=Ramlibacter sp. TaxID=1917967 RepID=UPI002B7702D1|nr:hypothetical protein [Ramlibacter sp.]HVZ47065.1 hypothetical protein [Ramlibacter sp.]